MKIRKSLATTIIAIFLVFNVLSILLFTYYTKAEGENSALDYAKQSMQEIVNEKGELIAIRFERLKASVDLLTMLLEADIQQHADIEDVPDSAYSFNEDGSVRRERDGARPADAQSNILAVWDEENREVLAREILLTEMIDEPMSIILRNEELIWGYIVTRNNLLRVSPYVSLDMYFDDNHMQNEDVFYTMADREHNPEGTAIITKPYNDYLGEGWTITCSKPVYDGQGEMFGVVCLDVSMKKLREEFFDGFSLGETGKILWLDQEGNLFYHSDYDNLSNVQGELYDKNIFDLPMSQEERAAVEKAINNQNGTILFGGPHSQQILVHAKIEDLNSSLIIQMDMNEFASEERFDLKKLMLLIAVDILLAASFAYILYWSFSRPMRKMVKQAERISQGDYGMIEEETGAYYEITQLNSAFNAMNRSIETYTETLLDKNQELSTILESIDTALMIVDMEGNVGARSSSSGGVSEERVKRALKRIREDRAFFEEQFVQGGEVYKNEYYPILLENNEVKKVVICSKCVTDSTLMEKEMQQLEKMAGVGQLSAAIVHELKNILARIKGAVYILSMVNQSEENREELEIIGRAMEEAQNVITTLLDFSRKSGGEGDVASVSTVINQILLLSKKELITKNVDVRVHLDDRCYIQAGGKEALKVILQNTIMNAIQAVDYDGRIEITCRRQESSVEIRVKDNGGGIQVTPKERIFEPFLSTKEDGNGIGLWITKRLVHTLSGSIEIADSRENETEFVITIPMREKDNAEDESSAG